MSEQRADESADHWHEGGDGHGYGYQYIGPIHYLCECGGYFLGRDGWTEHRDLLGLATSALPTCQTCHPYRPEATP